MEKWFRDAREPWTPATYFLYWTKTFSKIFLLWYWSKSCGKIFFVAYQRSFKKDPKSIKTQPFAVGGNYDLPILHRTYFLTHVCTKDDNIILFCLLNHALFQKVRSQSPSTNHAPSRAAYRSIASTRPNSYLSIIIKSKQSISYVWIHIFIFLVQNKLLFCMFVVCAIEVGY